MKAPSTLEQLKSVLLLPFMAIVIIPLTIHFSLSNVAWNPILNLDSNKGVILGILFLLLGLPLFVQSINLFIKIGKGTLAPWNPTKKLVVKSLYRYMRNPMILGVFLILLAESFLFTSSAILVWSFIFILINHLYFILKEEPDLLKRFGSEYKEYTKNVPRWLPRLKGWKPENHH